MPEFTEQDMYNEIFSEAMDEMVAYQKVCDAYNDRIYGAIERQIGAGFLKELKALIDNDGEGGPVGKMRIVDKPPGKFQFEVDYGCIVGIWIYQYSVGDSGDSFAGSIGVKLKQGRWLEFDFASS